jgi:insecticidal toxin complex protein TccC
MKQSFPKESESIKRIGEMAQTDGFTGAASLSIPISISGCRGSEPQLNLTYNSGSGNGVFGRGFHLSVPSISRQISKSVPRYDHRDTFVFSITDTLVPALNQNGQQQSVTRGSFTVTVFRPLIEKAFWTIERWEGGGKDFWRVLDDENRVSLYGYSSAAQIADPADPNRVFEWLLEAVVDRHGNAQHYVYKAEDLDGVDADATHEQNRLITANKYLHSICYGSPNPIAQPSLLQPDALAMPNGQWHFEVVFDYGEYQIDPTNSNPYHLPANAHWLARQDAFSTYKAGFEIRTSRLCRHVLMFHRFAELNGGEPVLVHALRCHYAESPTVTLLKAVEELGYQHRPNQAYAVECLPPLEFSYNAFAPAGQTFDLLRDENGTPLTGSDRYALIDLYGEGVPGLLYSDGQTTYYREPALTDAREETTTASPPLHYGPNLHPEILPLRQLVPDAVHTLVDITGNGHPDWVISAPGQNGWYEANPDRSWQAFRPFEHFPTDFHAPDSHLIDVTGDGLFDWLLIDRQAGRFYPNLREKGFGESQEIEFQEHLPASLRSSSSVLMTFADMAGSGQEHLVRVTASAVEYWPNLGYGRFGKPIFMSNAPQFDPATFHTSRVLLADIDGTGTTDLLYVRSDRVAVYLNQSGNAFSAPIEIMLPEPLDRLDQISFADVYGNGNSCLLYSKTHTALRRFCYDFTNGQKPYLLNRIVNNHGGETTFRYRSSAHFYLEDKQNQQPWITSLPFPIQVVERVEHKDLIANSTLVSRFHYHHGYYDGIEREFRGFGMIERRDAERLPQTDSQSPFFTAPTLVKTWYHTGAEQANTLARHYESEYYKGDTAAVLLPDASIDFGSTGSDAETLRMAQRALKGSVLREELYAEDDSPQQLHPYTVVETRYHLRLSQPKAGERYAVFFRDLQETLTYDYERNPNDPRISHEATLELDDFGYTRRSCHIAYGRRARAGNELEQNQIRATFLIKDFIHKREEDMLLIGFPKESQLFEIKDLQAPAGSEVFSFEKLTEMFALNAADRSKLFPASVSAERLHWERHFYIAPGQTAEAAFGEIPLSMLPCRTEEAAFTEQQTSEAPEALQSLMENPGRYQKHDGCWWNPGATSLYNASENFCLLRTVIDPFGNGTSYEYDDHHLMVTVTSDALNNRLRAEDIDYQRLQPRRIIDLNDNRVETLFDPLGRIFVTSHFGTENGQQTGFNPLSQYRPVVVTDNTDVIAHPERYLQDAAAYTFEDDFSWMGQVKPESFTALPLGAQERQSLFDDLIARGYMNQRGGLFQSFHDLTSSADLKLSDRFQQHRETLFALLGQVPRRQPVYTLKLIAETYPGGSQSPIRLGLSYMDGFGRLLQQKHKCEPGEALLIAAGNSNSNSNDIPSGVTQNRWWTSGRVEYDNKGNLVQQYEPFFADTHSFIDQPALHKFGASHTFFYDPLERATQVLTAKGFLKKREWTAWDETQSDENDTIKDAPYYKANDPTHPNSASPFFDPDRRPEVWEAVEKAEIFYKTPERYILNNLGQVIIQEETNTSERDPAQSILKTRHSRDIQGLVKSSADPRLGPRGIKNLQATIGLLGEALKVVSVDAGFSWSLSNCAGAMIYHESERGFKLQVSYDALHRPVELKVSGGDGPAPLDHVVQRIVYGDSPDSPIDPARRAAVNLNGKVIQHFDESGVTEFHSYSMLAQPLSISQRLALTFDQTISWPADAAARENLLQAGAPFNSVCEYDALGRATSAADPLGNIRLYSYDLSGMISSVKVKTPDDTEPQPYLKAAAHNARGQRLMEEYGNGHTVTRYSFDPKSFELIRAQTTSADNSAILDLQYIHDPVGNIRSVRKQVGLIPQSDGQPLELVSEYEYDALHQLIQATGMDLSQSADPQHFPQPSAYTQSFQYDDGRNLKKITYQSASKSNVTEMVVSETSNRAVSKEFAVDTQNVDRLFDRGGNQLQLRPNTPVKWNYHDNIQQVILSQDANHQVIESYVYNSAGRRARKVTKRRSASGATTIFEDCIYFGDGEIRRVIEGDDLNTGRVLEEIHFISVSDGEDRIATHQRWMAGDPAPGIARSQTRFVLNDLLDSFILEVDQAGRLLTFEEFYPYGDTAIIATGIAEQIRLKCYRYSGKERDNNTEAYYYGFRYYQPEAGRWLSSDPLGPIDGLNLYAFVRGNPATLVDVFGTNGRLKMRTKPSTSGGSTAKENAKALEDLFHSREFKNNVVKFHWKGDRDSITEETSGIEVNIIKRPPDHFTAGQKRARSKMNDRFSKDITFTPLKNRYGYHYAEISHLVAATLTGSSDAVGAITASSAQNTEWLAIENGIKALSKSLKSKEDLRFKVTGYVFEVEKDVFVLKASRFKIYINGKKMFDHLSDGLRSNIDLDEANNVQKSIENLPTANTLVTNFPQNYKHKNKGMTGKPPASSLVMKNNKHLKGATNRNFTEIEVKPTKRLKGEEAQKYAEELFDKAPK